MKENFPQSKKKPELIDTLRQSGSREATPGIPTDFTKAARQEQVQSIIEKIQSNQPRWLLEKSLYTYLTERVSSGELQTIQQSFEGVNGKQEYYTNLAGVLQTAASQGISFKDSIGWFTLDGENVPTRRKEKFIKNGTEDAGSVAVSYKEYFTIPIQAQGPQDALNSIKTFQNLLPAIARDLTELAKENGDAITLKTPDNLQYFIKHPDSLVIHYRNPELSGRVRAIVERHLASVGLDSTRGMRAESGFDFRSDNELFDGSHSSLMSSIAAARMIEMIKTQPELANANPEEIGAFVDRAFSEYAKFTPAQMLERLDAIKKRR